MISPLLHPPYKHRVLYDNLEILNPSHFVYSLAKFSLSSFSILAMFEILGKSCHTRSPILSVQ